MPPQSTPPELVDRNFVTVDLLPPPSGRDFEATIEPLAGEPLERSTWDPSCPVTIDGLRYVTMSFWGFDGRPHTGEMIVNRAVADDLVSVFKTLYDARFHIEQMRISTPADLDAAPTGDGNNTTSFVCREAVGRPGTLSEHAYGLAVDVNPFHNPYVRGDLVLPELARAYTDRSSPTRGMIVEGDVVTKAFDQIGWGWGGRWTRLKDYQHFSRNGR